MTKLGQTLCPFPAVAARGGEQQEDDERQSNRERQPLGAPEIQGRAAEHRSRGPAQLVGKDKGGVGDRQVAGGKALAEQGQGEGLETADQPAPEQHQYP